MCRLTPCTWRRTALLHRGLRTTSDAPTGRRTLIAPCTSKSDAQHHGRQWTDSPRRLACPTAFPQAVGVAFEPVFQNADGKWEAPDFAYLERRAGWQKYLDEKLKKRDYLPDSPLTTEQPQPAADASSDGQPRQACRRPDV